MACAFVMLAMRYFPGEVGNKERPVQHPARGIVQRFGIRSASFSSLPAYTLPLVHSRLAKISYEKVTKCVCMIISFLRV